MSLEINFDDQRSEPRFYPPCEEVRWHKAGRGDLQSGELLDVSKMGLSFCIQPDDETSPKLGEHLTVGLLGIDSRPQCYAVVWERRAAEKLMLGCVRLTSQAPVEDGKTPSPQFVLAVNRRTIGGKAGEIEVEMRNVTLGSTLAPNS